MQTIVQNLSHPVTFIHKAMLSRITSFYKRVGNHHLKNRMLALEAKGLLSLILMLPDEWNYTTHGLAFICREGVDSIGGALRALAFQAFLMIVYVGVYAVLVRTIATDTNIYKSDLDVHRLHRAALLYAVQDGQLGKVHVQCALNGMLTHPLKTYHNYDRLCLS